MNLRLLDSQTDRSYISDARRHTLSSIGLPPDDRGAAPLAHAVYLGLFVDGHQQPAGLAEAYFLDQAFVNFADCPYKAAGLAETCAFAQMAWIRTIYVDADHRRRSPFYLYLYLAMAHVFRELGASHSGMTTRAGDPSFDRLYLKTGGRLLGYTAAPFFEHARLALYVFDLQALMRHRRYPYVAERLAVDYVKARAIRSRRAPRASAT